MRLRSTSSRVNANANEKLSTLKSLEENANSGAGIENRGNVERSSRERRGRGRGPATRAYESDVKAVALLLLLYTLQGVPMGLSASLAFMMHDRGGTYAEQGKLSLASWPFSLKVMWAPIVDAMYVRRVGRRRTWVIPLQIVVGLTLLALSKALGGVMSESGSDVEALAWTFFWIYILLASQDIAVDGWALTMLSAKNVGLASTCNAIGQMAGFFISFTGFLVLNSYGLDLGAFISFWGYVFLASSLFVYMTKEKECGAHDLSVKEAYAQAMSILKLPAVLKLSAVLLTRYIAFSASETLTTLKLLEKGVPKSHMATMSALLTPLNLAMPMLTRKWTAGPRPLDTVAKTWVIRGVVCACAAALVHFAPDVKSMGGAIPYRYYALLFLWMAVYGAFSSAHFISFMAFYNRVSDANLGGTYMTILNTISNLGAKWVESVTLFSVDAVSAKICVSVSTREVLGSCATAALKEECKGRCMSSDAPYYFLVLLSPILAFLWIKFARRTIDWLSLAKMSEWRVKA